MSRFPEIADIETASDDYATRFSGDVGEYFLDTQLNQVLYFLQNYNNPSILDVGGGHGQLAIPLIERGYDVTITGSANSCEDRLKRELQEGSYTYQTCNMLQLPYDDNSFDIVLAFRLLPHVDRWQELIAELVRVANYGIIIDYPDIRSANILNSLLFSFKKSMEGNTRPFLLFSRKMIRQAFFEQKCKEIQFQPAFSLPMVLHRKINSSSFSKGAETFFRFLGITSLFGSPVVTHIQKKSVS